MPRSSGTYTLPAGNPVTTGTTITSTWANTTLSDIATALTGSVATDGSSGMTGALQMGNNKITGVADGVNPTDVATVNQIGNPIITGGTIDGAPIGAADPKNGNFLALSSTSAAFGGISTATTVTPATDNSTKIATTAFVQSAISAVSSGVTTFNTRSGNVTLTSLDVTTALGYTPYNAAGNTVITTGNISTYAPTVNGTGAYGLWYVSITGNAATVTNGVYTTGNQSIAGVKVFSSTISGSIDGNAATVTNGVYTTGTQTIGGSKTFSSTLATAAITASGQITANGGYKYSSSNWTSGWDGSTSINFDYSAVTKIQFQSSGTILNSTGTYGTISDLRIKENIVAARSYLDSLCQLNVVNYNIVGNEQKMLGFIAQEVEQVMPGLVETAKNTQYGIDDFKSIKTTVIIPMLVQAIKELKAEIDALKGV